MTLNPDLLRSKNALRMSNEGWKRFLSSALVKDTLIANDRFKTADDTLEISEYIISKATTIPGETREYQITLLVYAEYGGTSEIVREKTRAVRPNIPGQILIVDTEMAGQLVGDKGPFHSICAEFKKNKFDELLLDYSSDGPQVFRQLLDQAFRDGDVEVMMRGILNSGRRGEFCSHESAVNHRLYCLAKRLYEIAKSKMVLEDRVDVPQPIQAALDHLERNLPVEVGVKELAEMFGMNRGHFSRQFHKATNQTPKDYLKRLRLEKAKGLLRDEEEILPISKVAEQCGYTNASHLHRDLRKEMGMTPGEYREISRVAAFYAYERFLPKNKQS